MPDGSLYSQAKIKWMHPVRIGEQIWVANTVYHIVNISHQIERDAYFFGTTVYLTNV